MTPHAECTNALSFGLLVRQYGLPQSGFEERAKSQLTHAPLEEPTQRPESGDEMGRVAMFSFFGWAQSVRPSPAATTDMQRDCMQQKELGPAKGLQLHALTA